MIWMEILNGSSWMEKSIILSSWGQGSLGQKMKVNNEAEMWVTHWEESEELLETDNMDMWVPD